MKNDAPAKNVGKFRGEGASGGRNFLLQRTWAATGWRPCAIRKRRAQGIGLARCEGGEDQDKVHIGSCAQLAFAALP